LQLSILSTPPPSGHEHLPIAQTLVLDPWLEPLPAPGPVPHLKRLDNANADGDTLQDDTAVTDASLSPPLGRNPDLPRMLVINSETFTLWEDHFSRLQLVVKAWEPEGKRIITLGELFFRNRGSCTNDIHIVGSNHQSFSDFPILPFIRTRDSLKLHDIIANASLAFLDSNFAQYIEETLTREMEAFVIGVKANGKPKRKLQGDVGDIIVH
jgi:platelet-activating factor acetylhydrolase